MKYTSNQHERESDSKPAVDSHISNRQGMVMKRLLFLLMAIFMTFAGAQSMPTTKASAPCKMVCTDYIDPLDGQCYTRCCPEDSACKIRCIIMPCDR